MNRPRRHPLFVLLCALFLLGAQQAAFAHFLGHFGFAPHTAVQQGNDGEHGAAATLSHVCTTCAAFAALDAGPPLAAAATFARQDAAAPLVPYAAADAPGPAAPPYDAHAPPAVL